MKRIKIEELDSNGEILTTELINHKEIPGDAAAGCILGLMLSIVFWIIVVIVGIIIIV